MVIHTIDCLAGAHGVGEAGRVGGFDVEARPEMRPGDEFGRLVRLVRDNERLSAEMEAVRAQARRAWAYLSEPGCNAGLAMAQLERLRLKRSALLAHLRANRVEARALLGDAPPGDDLDQIELN